MRIVGGTFAGRDLVSPSGRVRPTAEAVRVACMQMLAGRLVGASFLDLFAGSGGVGLEALSRGAARCDFVENNPSALHSLKANVAALRVRARSRIFKRDVIPFVQALPPDAYDIAFVDPPYGSGKLDRVLREWQARPFSRVLVLEHAADLRLSVHGESRRIGESALTLVNSPSLRIN